LAGQVLEFSKIPCFSHHTPFFTTLILYQVNHQVSCRSLKVQSLKKHFPETTADRYLVSIEKNMVVLDLVNSIDIYNKGLMNPDKPGGRNYSPNIRKSHPGE
jgi:hypothetical protein